MEFSNYQVERDFRGQESATYAVMLRILICIGISQATNIGDVFAQDRVELQRPQLSGRVALQCEILEYNGDIIRIRLNPDAPPRTYPASEVVSITTNYSQPHEAGAAQFAERQVVAAEKSLHEALNIESRMWVRREIVALLTRCALYRGDYVAAGTRFVSLVSSDPNTRHFKLIPVAWMAVPLKSATEAAAKSWLDDRSDVARLIGASLLFEHPDWGRRAAGEMEKLASSVNERVRHLARVQLWRIDLKSGEIPESRMQRWNRQFHDVPEDLRGGAHYLLGLAHSQRHEYERAAQSFLWVPFIYHYDHHLAADAHFQAAKSLASAGQIEEAKSLLREVIKNYTETPFAEQASSYLGSVGGS